MLLTSQQIWHSGDRRRLKMGSADLVISILSKYRLVNFGYRAPSRVPHRLRRGGYGFPEPHGSWWELKWDKKN